MNTGRSIDERRARAVRTAVALLRSRWLITSSRACPDRAHPDVRANGADPVPDEEATVRQRLRGLLATGGLPGIRISKIGGRKSGGRQDCTICGAGIGVGEAEFEIPPPDGMVVIVHRRCFDLWTQEAADRVAEAEKAQSAPSPSRDGQNVTFRRLSPRRTEDSRHSGEASAKVSPGARRSKVPSAIWPSTRASGAPRQKWMP